MSYAMPQGSEPVFSKTTNSAFIGTSLEQAIRDAGVQKLVFCGLTTGHCVSTSVRMASNLEIVPHAYDTPALDESRRGRIVLVGDGTAMFDVVYCGKTYDAQSMHAMHLASLHGEFCDVESTAEVVRKLHAAGEDVVI